MDTDKALELARCAQINLENLTKQAPVLSGHPMLLIAKTQLEQCIAALEEE